MLDVLTCNVIKMLLNVLKLKDVLLEDYYAKMDHALIHSRIALKYLAHCIYQSNVVMDSVLIMLNSVMLTMDAHSINNTNVLTVNVFLTLIPVFHLNALKTALSNALMDLANPKKKNVTMFRVVLLKLPKNVVMEIVLTLQLLHVALLFVLKKLQSNASMVFVLKLTLDVLHQLIKTLPFNV